MILKRESEEEINDTIIYPADYYNKGDILLNYFLIESSILKELVFTTDFNIIYKNDSDITLSWNKYVYKLKKGNKINIPTNYSIYILPKNSIVNTICQLHLIPSNKSIINKTETKIELNDGEYKIAIIATIIDEEMPFEIMYNILELNVIKRANITLIIPLGILVAMIVIFIFFFIFRKKLRKKRISSNYINDSSSSINNVTVYAEEEEDEEEEIEKNKLTSELIKFINQK